MEARVHPSRGNAKIYHGAALLPLLLAAAALPGAPEAAGPQLGPGSVFCRLQLPDLREASGLAASPSGAEIYWTHNDSGRPDGPPRNVLYAFDEQGRERAARPVEDAVNSDWEDIGALPAREGRPGALFIADTGDNAAQRAGNLYTVYRVGQPEIGLPGEPARAPVRTEARWSFSYPDGRKDAETLLVDPEDAALYVVTKPDFRELPQNEAGEYVAECEVYQIVPTEREGEAEAVPRGSVTYTHPLALGAVPTGGSVAADRSRLVIRTYRVAHLYEVRPEEALWQALQRPPTRIELPLEPQGEGIAFRPGGRSLLTISEALFGWNVVWEVPLVR